ncbi:hypothetical protein [Chitinivibrio alkaliphilus]|uniref:Uncharacterized protein n=1 Tax=Chitinivibrio alkaliphilus ACht1 TaxID=1313304 RepID=U7D5Q9_9BACT|nr:hypothetical protein [Chitinivibrio alkaliphilus]ERP30886.1 hypothetical protein CALK_2254 [Chitinivibrio alkaliphilus ACht1]
MKAIVNSTAAVLILVFFSVGSAETEINWFGGVEYRLRTNIDGGDDAAGEEIPREADFRHQYGWRLGNRVTLSEDLSFGFQLNNIGARHSHAGDNEGVKAHSSEYQVQISRAYAQFSKNILDISAGIVPVSANTALDVGQHLVLGNTHFDMSGGGVWNDHIQSQVGFLFSLSPSEQVGVHSAIATTGNQGALIPDNDDQVLDGYRVSLHIPISLDKISLTPALSVQTGIYEYESDPLDPSVQRPVPGTGSAMVSGGIDFRATPGSIDFRGGLAYGMLETEEDIDRQALMIKVNPRLTLPQGTLSLGYSLGHTTDEITDIAYTRHYTDINYTHQIRDNLTIRPRFRTYTSINDEDDAKALRLRPELIFAARF